MLHLAPLLLPALDADGPEGGVLGLWLELVGRAHPALVHFPIAFLLLAALIEGVNALGGLFGRESGRRPARTAWILLLFAALSAAATTFSGWTLSERMTISPKYAELIEWHRWSGVATAGVALVALVPALLARGGERRGALRGYRLLLLIGAGGVGFTGHQGGQLVHGLDELTEPIEALVAHYTGKSDVEPEATVEREPQAEVAPGVGQEIEGQAETSLAEPEALPAGAEDEGAAEEPQAVAPEEALARAGRALMGKHCVECHNAVQNEASLRLDTRAEIVAGDWLIEDGDPADSIIHERVTLPVDDEYHMPKEGEPLTEDEIALLEDWIRAGLPWPADGEPAGEVE